MAAPYHTVSDPSYNFFPAPIPSHFIPTRSGLATTSPTYSPSVDQGPWPQAHVAPSVVGLPVVGPMSMPGPRISRSSASGSSGSGVMIEEQEAQRRNPLVDLMESEKLYAEQLGLIIRVSCLILPCTLNDLLGSQLHRSEPQVHGLEKTFRQLS